MCYIVQNKHSQHGGILDVMTHTGMLHFLDSLTIQDARQAWPHRHKTGISRHSLLLLFAWPPWPLLLLLLLLLPAMERSKPKMHSANLKGKHLSLFSGSAFPGTWLLQHLSLTNPHIVISICLQNDGVTRLVTCRLCRVLGKAAYVTAQRPYGLESLWTAMYIEPSQRKRKKAHSGRIGHFATGRCTIPTGSISFLHEPCSYQAHAWMIVAAYYVS